MPTKPRPAAHPTWDRILEHVARSSAAADPLRLKEWVCDLVLCPNKPQPGLLLTGPQVGGKTTFHEAMGLLLPAGTVMSFQGWVEEQTDDYLHRAWLWVADPVFLVDWTELGARRRAGDRYLKQCFVADDPPRRPLPNVHHYRVGCLAKTIPKRELMCRLEDEQDAFLRTLRNYPMRT